MLAKPKINNDIYNDYSTGWWDKGSFLNILETGIQPVRSQYIQKCIQKHNIVHPQSLDIGCGGGILTEDLAQFSAKTHGVDISEASLKTAREHAEKTGFNIDYENAHAENLPFPDNSFDLVTCCDVLEHVDDLSKVISEINRVLKTNGLFVYDTVNRTLMSYLSLIFIAQDFPLTRFAPKHAHVWHKFIRPKELLPLFEKHNLKSEEQIGMAPSVNPLTVLWYILQVKYRHLDFATFGTKTQFRTSRDKSISYLGYCIKP